MTKINLEEVSFWKQFAFVMKCELKSLHKKMLRDPMKTGVQLIICFNMFMVAIFAILPLVYYTIVAAWSKGVIIGLFITVPNIILLYATGVSVRNMYLYLVHHYEAEWDLHLRRLDYVKNNKEKVDN